MNDMAVFTFLERAQFDLIVGKIVEQVNNIGILTLNTKCFFAIAY
jgi:hypothetical protein